MPIAQQRPPVLHIIGYSSVFWCVLVFWPLKLEPIRFGLGGMCSEMLHVPLLVVMCSEMLPGIKLWTVSFSGHASRKCCTPCLPNSACW